MKVKFREKERVRKEAEMQENGREKSEQVKK